jgi:hypothetical protein
MDNPDPIVNFRGKEISLTEAREQLPEGFLAVGGDGALHVFEDLEDLAQRSSDHGVELDDPRVQAPSTPSDPPDPVYEFEGRRMTIKEARELVPNGIVYAAPDSERDGVFYVVESEDQVPALADRLGLRPDELERWMSLVEPAKVVFLRRVKKNGAFEVQELTRDEFAALDEPTALAGPNTEIDGKFFVFERDQPVSEQAEWMGLDPNVLEEWNRLQDWSQSQNA